MIQIVMKPDKAPVVNHEGLYVALLNGRDIGLRVRALRASHAEAKLTATLEKSVEDRKDNGVFTIDFDLEEWLRRKDGEENANDSEGEVEPGNGGA